MEDPTKDMTTREKSMFAAIQVAIMELQMRGDKMEKGNLLHMLTLVHAKAAGVQLTT